MKDAIYYINRSKGKSQSLLDAIEKADPADPPGNIHPGTLTALKGRVQRLDRFTFVKDLKKGDSLDRIIKLITDSNQSIVIDFGKFGTDLSAYMFLANIITRRLYSKYSRQTVANELPQLIVFLEEAHKY